MKLRPVLFYSSFFFFFFFGGGGGGRLSFCFCFCFLINGKIHASTTSILVVMKLSPRSVSVYGCVCVCLRLCSSV